MNIDLFPDARSKPEDDKNSRFTLRPTMDWCKRTARSEEWDIDVAACEECHWAPRYFTEAEDGLVQYWRGRIWCNPPYKHLEPWLMKAWSAWVTDAPVVIAMLIPADRVEQPFWQRWVEPFRDGRASWPQAPDVLLTTHNLPGRQEFGHPGNKHGVNVDGAPFPVVLLVWRRIGAGNG